MAPRTPKISGSHDRLAAVAADAATDSGVDQRLLGDFVGEAMKAIISGQRLSTPKVRQYEEYGAQAAAEGVELSALIDLYLSSVWRLWREIPELTPLLTARPAPAPLQQAVEGVLHTTDDVVAAVAAGYQRANSTLLTRSAAAHREFVDDLLSNHGAPGELLERARGFGLRLAASHRVAVIRSTDKRIDESSPLTGYALQSLRSGAAASDSIVTSKDGNIVLVVGGPAKSSRSQIATAYTALRRTDPSLALAVGRSHADESGPMRSFREATECLLLIDRLRLATGGAYADDLVVYLALWRDPVLLRELVATVLTPLEQLRGGAVEGVETLRAYLDHRGSATATAGALHLSVRGLTYRIERIQRLLSHDLDDPHQRLTVELALLAATLLDWPTSPITAATHPDPGSS